MITPRFKQGGTGVLTASFSDENGDPVTPNSVSWSLYSSGKIVNGREDVVVSPAQSIDIVLSGDDLAITGGHWLVIEARYDSSLGTNLPLVEWQAIIVDDNPGE